MNLEELLKGVEDEATRTSITEAFNKQQKAIDALKATNNGLLDDKATWKQKTETAQEEAQRLAEEKMKAENDWEGLKASQEAKHAKEAQELRERLDASNSTILNSKKQAIVNDLASQFVDAGAGKLLLENMILADFAEDGSVALKLVGTDKAEVSSDPSKFAEAVMGMDNMAPFLKGPNSSGAGASGGSGGGANPNSATFKPSGTAKDMVAHLDSKK